MTSCTLVFMLWLSKFEHANCCWYLGRFGWFMHESDSPITGWYSFDKTPEGRFKDAFHDGIEYKKDMTNHFDITKKPIKLNESDTLVNRGGCTLDGKKYIFQEYVSIEK